MSSDNHIFDRILLELKEYVFTNHKLPSVSDIAELSSISSEKCRESCEELEKQKRIYTISGGGHGKPRIIIPFDMMESIFSTQPKPIWISEELYSFKEIEKLQSAIKKNTEEISKFEKFQMLLYGTDIPLEKSIAFALEYLEFNDVVHHIENRGYADVTFKKEDRNYLIEAVGTSKRGDKSKVLQLDGWLRIDIEAGVPAKQLQGIFMVNHERDTPPNERRESLTPHAIEFMERYDFILITTPFLFEVVQQVHYGKMSKEEARELIIKGQDIR